MKEERGDTVKINQVETITGLTQKAIRLYEAKGLLRVDRSENGYRNYSERDVETLKTIKLLREAGVAIPDIKLYLCGVITLDEMVDKRKKEIEAESGKSSSQYRSCERLAGRITEGKAASNSLFTEAESDRPAEYGALAVDVSFCGKRWDPHCRGSVQQIDRQNFTPSALTLGVLDGMCNELYELYSLFPTEGTQIIASGGAVRKNEVLRKRLRDRFRVPIQVNTVEEEAASGAALFATLAIGRISYDNGFSDYITY